MAAMSVLRTKTLLSACDATRGAGEDSLGGGRRGRQERQQEQGVLSMNKDRITGAAKEAKGAVKDATGQLIGSEKLQVEGKADKVEGKAQNTAGKVKDALPKG